MTQPDAIEHITLLPTPDMMLRIYLERRREALIIELREIDRLLGRPQTIATRQRGR